MAAEEQRNGGHRSRGGATGQGAGDTDATLSLGAAAEPGVELARPAHARERAPGNREALFGKRTREEARRSGTLVACLLWGNRTKRGGRRPASAAPAACGRRRSHSLVRAPQVRSFRNADWRRRQHGRQFRVSRPRPPARRRAGALTLATEATAPKDGDTY
ncbi:At-Rich Interactive Domain-Containing Protein 5A [Manis pentadactyla]|nr:At-Rich Interactive Domain-Containing Protein 5A [Manis pentadactyla]